MGLVQHVLRRCGTRPRFALDSVCSSSTRIHEECCYARVAPLAFLPSVPRRAFCSVEEGRNVPQLTLANLGFKEEEDDDEQAGIEAIRAPTRESGRGGHQRRMRERPQPINSSVLPAPMPSPEEMKQAALDVSNILAGIAGMQLPRSKKLAGDQPAEAALKQVAVEEGEEEIAMPAMARVEPSELNHPWPEWLKFLADIHARGFFDGSEQGVEENKHLFESYAAVRHAVNAFGRMHTNIFRSLSRKDLRVMANYGCPDLERKASNASKRLRAHFNIPEGEVSHGWILCGFARSVSFAG